MRITCSDNDIQSVSAIPCTGSSFQGAYQLTDLGTGFGTGCTVPIHLSPAVTHLTETGPEESSGPWKATTGDTGGKHRLQGHLDSGCTGDTLGVGDNSKGSEEITPDFVFVTPANSRVFQHLWRQQQSVFQREENQCDLHNQ